MKKMNGFTLVELLIVIVIIGILAGSLLLVMGSGSDRAKAAVIFNDVVVLKNAALVYFTENDVMPDAIELVEPFVDKKSLAEPSGVSYGISNQEEGYGISVNLELAGNGVREKLAMLSGGPGLFSDAAFSLPYNGENMAYSPFSRANALSLSPEDEPPNPPAVTPEEYFTVGNPSTFKITGFANNPELVPLSDLVLPGTIGGIAITEIGHAAFDGKALTSVVLPATLTTIGALAFRGNNLESVIIPDGLKTIGNISFMNNQITELSFPDSVTRIGDGAFQSNPITRVTIGEAVDIGTVYSLGQYGSAFKNIYDGNGKQSGTYVYEGGHWVKE